MATDFIMPRAPTAHGFYQASQQSHMPSLAAFQSAQQQQQQQLPPMPAPLPQPQHHRNNFKYSTPFVNAANAATAAQLTPQYHPQISPLSTSNSGAPASPKSAYHTRQVRPLYIPAVLRPTEHPSREVPNKARQRKAELDGGAGGLGNNVAADGSDEAVRGDSGRGGSDGDDDDAIDGSGSGSDSDSRWPVRASGSFISLPGLGSFNIRRLSRRATNDSGKSVSSAWGNLDLFPAVQGMPSRGHWKPDMKSTMCDEPACKKSFNYFTRRHHCRRCGNIFCDMHSAFEIPLDEKAQYNPRGTPSRACAYCFHEFKVWRSQANSSDASSNGSSTPRAGSGDSASPNDAASAAAAATAAATADARNAIKAGIGRSATAPTSPVMALAASGRPGAPGTPTMPRAPDVAQSVPGDWNWSTF